MAILIDPPQWPAHGTLWSHLVSDESYDELHAFARHLGLPRRSFDLDHYDLPASRYDHAIALGARPVLARDIVHQLQAAGLRVRQVERDTVQPVRRRQYLVAEWASLSEMLREAHGTGQRDNHGGSAGAPEGWLSLGDELIGRWNEPHRRYHDERHLEDVLLALDHLATRGERVNPVTLVAAWFHDAVYTGGAGAAEPASAAETWGAAEPSRAAAGLSDELASAQFATAALGNLGVDTGFAQQVGELIVATTPGVRVDRPADPLAHLLDADLAIFASPRTRYDEYAAAVRAEYAHIAHPEFRSGRGRILSEYLERPTVYHTGTAQALWEARARVNLEREIAALAGIH